MQNKKKVLIVIKRYQMSVREIRGNQGFPRPTLSTKCWSKGSKIFDFVQLINIIQTLVLIFPVYYNNEYLRKRKTLRNEDKCIVRLTFKLRHCETKEQSLQHKSIKILQITSLKKS